MKRVKTGFFERALSLTSVAVNTGQKFLSYKLSQMQLDPEQFKNKVSDLLKLQAEDLVVQMGQLKGSVMKVGQMLSVYGEYFLSPEINKLLKTLQFSSTPLSWESIEKTLSDELGANRLKELEIETKPFACAYIGHVHRAKIKATGEIIALKIQYPGIEKAIQSDMTLLKSFFKVLELTKKIPHMDLLFNEVQSMLLQEIDYSQELQFTQEFAARLKDDPRFIVPKTYPYYSTRKVIALEWCGGELFDSPQVQNLNISERNHLAEALFDLYMRELTVWGSVQTDPHMGNYRVKVNQTSPHQVILYDFGAVRILPRSFVDNYLKILIASLNQDVETLRTTAYKMKFLQEGDPESLVQLFIDFCDTIVEPFKDSTPATQHLYDGEGHYKWGFSDLPKRLTQKVGYLLSNYNYRVPPQEVVFLDRKTGGLFIIFAVLKTSFPAKAILRKYINTEKPT